MASWNLFFKFGWSLGDYTVVAQQRWGCCITNEPHGLKTTRCPNNRVRGKSPKRWLLQMGDTSLHSPGHCQNLEKHSSGPEGPQFWVCKDCKFTNNEENVYMQGMYQYTFTQISFTYPYTYYIQYVIYIYRGPQILSITQPWRGTAV